MDRKTGKFERLRYDPAHPEKLSGPPRKKEVDLDIDLFFIQQDGSGAVWIGASSGWITRYDPSTKKVAHYDSFNDDTQAMWGRFQVGIPPGMVLFGSRPGAVMFIGLTLFITLFRIFPTASIVHAIHEDVSGELWIGTLGKGLIRTDRSKGTTKQFSTGSQSPFSLSDSWITAIYAGDDDELWIGSHNHLHRYERKTQIFNQYINDSQDETSFVQKAGCSHCS
jgi:ligand-binding sensor domain-containing protein